MPGERTAKSEAPPVGKVVLTPERAQEIRELWKQAPEIQSLLPLKFESGSQVDSFDPECCCCQRAIPKKLLRGRLTRPTPDTALIDAWAVCEHCLIWVPFHYLVRGKPFQIEWQDSETGDWLASRGRYKHPVSAWIRVGLRRLWALLRFKG